MKSLRDRIESKVERVPFSGCWLWLGALSKNGYGNLKTGTGHSSAHRASFLLFRGDPGALQVLHRCDVKCCINPDHLFLGTAQDNSVDMVTKGRAPLAVLGVEDIPAIRARLSAGESQAGIARDYGLHRKTIGKISRRVTWAHA